MRKTGEESRDGGASMSGTNRSVLIVANEEVAGDVAEAVVAEVRRAAGNRTPAVHLVCPALASSGLKHTLGDIDYRGPFERFFARLSLIGTPLMTFCRLSSPRRRSLSVPLPSRRGLRWRCREERRSYHTAGAFSTMRVTPRACGQPARRTPAPAAPKAAP